MKTRRILSCLLALVMMASMLPAGFAATSGPYNPTPVNPQPSADDSGSSQSAHIHTWQLLKVEEEATCTSYGQVTEVCYDCGAIRQAYINMLPHTWGDWEITVRATDHTAGEKQHTCEVCGKTETEKYYLEGTVLPGSSGEEVEELQDLINENGIPCARDGEYGDSTREAVREVQRRNGLEVDGIAWLQTVNHLQHRFGDWEVLREPTLTKPGLQHRICEICGYDEREEFIEGFGPGARGEHVRELQHILAELGYYDGRIDGDYGDGVKRAVIRWQRDHGMEPTGIVDDETLNSILEEYIDSRRRQEPDEQEKEDDLEEREEPDLPDEPPEDEDEPSAGEVAGVMIKPENASAALEFRFAYNSVYYQNPENGEYYMPGQRIVYYLTFGNTGNVPITKAEIYFLREENLKHNDKFTVNNMMPGEGDSWNNPRQNDKYGPGHHIIDQTDADSGEFSDFAVAYVTFENGKSITLHADLHVPVGGVKSSVSASFTSVPLTQPKNKLFYTEGEQIDFYYLLEDTCSFGLNYKIHSLFRNYVELVYYSYSVLKGFKPETGYLEAMDNVKFHHDKSLPHTVTADDCELGKYSHYKELAHCTFDNGAKRSYVAGFEAPCGVEKPGASLEIVETSTKNNGEYYIPGETITYDYVLTNTGNIILSYVTLKSSESGPTLSFGSQNLMPGESVTIHSGSKTVTAEMLKSGKTVDVTGYADCLFTSAAPNGTAKASAEDKKSFDIGGRPAAELYLYLQSAPENDKFIKDDEVAYSAELYNSGEVDMTGATLKVSYNGGAAEELTTIPSLAPGSTSDEYPFSHTVKEADAQHDELKCVVTGECTFADGSVLPVSAEAVVDIGNPALKVDIIVSSTAPDGFYKRNEQVDYQVTVSNIGNMDFESVRATVMPSDGEKGYAYILQMDGFAAGASETRPHAYTVTMDDVAAGSVTAEATAYAVLPSGKEVEASADVTVTTGMLPANISIQKTVSNTPSKADFYVENEVITYDIIVTNNGKEAVPSVIVTDNSPSETVVLDTILEFQPGDSLSYTYSYIVTGKDVEKGNVHNDAQADAVLPDGSGSSAISSADSETGVLPPAEEGAAGPVTWYLHTIVEDGTAQNALDLGMDMFFTLYEDGHADLVINDETTSASWTQDEETLTLTVKDEDTVYTKVEDTLENGQEGSLMIFRREKPVAGEA